MPTESLAPRVKWRLVLGSVVIVALCAVIGWLASGGLSAEGQPLLRVDFSVAFVAGVVAGVSVMLFYVALQGRELGLRITNMGEEMAAMTSRVSTLDLSREAVDGRIRRAVASIKDSLGVDVNWTPVTDNPPVVRAFISKGEQKTEAVIAGGDLWSEPLVRGALLRVWSKALREESHRRLSEPTRAGM